MDGNYPNTSLLCMLMECHPELNKANNESRQDVKDKKESGVHKNGRTDS
jgi:hypothetical protein